MSRSYKRIPIHGITTAESEKEDKRIWNRSFRKTAKGKIRGATDFDAVALPQNIHKETEFWKGAKDGKYWFDALKFPEEMRK
jgi:hypothetical protein